MVLEMGGPLAGYLGLLLKPSVDSPQDAAKRSVRSGNASQFTRSEIRTAVPRRYLGVKLSFSWDGNESAFLRMDDGKIPYISPRNPGKGKSVAASN
jgi:hypothetical protein